VDATRQPIKTPERSELVQKPCWLVRYDRSYRIDRTQHSEWGM